MADGVVCEAKPPRKFGELRRLPAASVVIMAGGAPEPLRRCLASLLRQDFLKDCYEIIVVDPDDLEILCEVVLESARGAAGSPSIQYLIADGRRGLAAARNRGWMYSRGAVIAFIDADVVPAANWLSRGMAALTPGVAAIRGGVRVHLPASPSDHQREVAALSARGLAGSNSFVHRAALVAINGFDERFSAAWHSDADLQFMLIEHFRDRQRVRQEPLAEVLWRPRPVGWDASLRGERWRQFDVLLSSKHPTLFREHFGSAARDLMHAAHLSVVGLLALASSAVLAANFVLAVVAVGLWTVLTAGFCVHRLNGSRRRPADVLGAVMAAIVSPPLAVFWRCVGALRFRKRPRARFS